MACEVVTAGLAPAVTQVRKHLRRETWRRNGRRQRIAIRLESPVDVRVFGGQVVDGVNNGNYDQS